MESTGGVAGDGSDCGTLFALTTQPGTTAANDTALALLYLANNPGMNTAALFSLSSSNATFQPVLTQAPVDFSLRTMLACRFTVSPSGPIGFGSVNIGSSSAANTVTLTNSGTTAIMLTRSCDCGRKHSGLCGGVQFVLGVSTGRRQLHPAGPVQAHCRRRSRSRVGGR